MQHGFSVDLAWIQCGLRAGVSRTQCGFSTDLVWNQCVSSTDLMRIQRGFTADLAWIQHGFSAYIVWIQRRFCLSLACTQSFTSDLESGINNFALDFFDQNTLFAWKIRIQMLETDLRNFARAQKEWNATLEHRRGCSNVEVPALSARAEFRKSFLTLANRIFPPREIPQIVFSRASPGSTYHEAPPPHIECGIP